jgi:tetratricopeptide (TPR) repeat protein
MKTLFVLFSMAAMALAQNSRDFLNQGVTAFKNSQYPEAVQLFQKAVDADPAFVTARLYLATAYMQQYVPGQDSAENRALAQSALREFNRVLELDPVNQVATASIASLYLNQKQWDQARQWYVKLTEMNPANAEAYYSMGFIAWSQWYPDYTDTRKQMTMRPQDPGPLPDGSLKTALKTKYLPILAQGIQDLEKALELNPQYDDAMAYMNLLIRERADLFDNQDEYQREIKIADEWVQKALATKKQKAQAKN